jgi:hypothetical protein
MVNKDDEGDDDCTDGEQELSQVKIYVRKEDVEFIREVAKRLKFDDAIADELRAVIRKAATTRRRSN